MHHKYCSHYRLVSYRLSSLASTARYRCTMHTNEHNSLNNAILLCSYPP